MQKTWISVLMLLMSSWLLAQELPDPSLQGQQLVDDLFADPDGALNTDEAIENFFLLTSNPLNINRASAEEFRSLSFLSEYQIGNIINHRHQNGDFLSLYELQVVPGLDEGTIRRMLPFVTMTSADEQVNGVLLRRILHEKNNYFIMRYERTLEPRAGFNTTNPDSRFVGSPDKWYLRFRTSRPDDFSVGFTLEKDAGEMFQWSSSQYGFDFMSFHVQLKNKGRLTNLIAGDYLLQSGQGLVLGGLFGLGKGGETITATRKVSLGAMPYTSSGENAALRGITATYKIGHDIYLTGYFSSTRRDASLDSDSLDILSIRSFQTTGFHRNQREINNRKAISEIQYGGIAQLKRGRFESGLTWNTTRFENEVHTRPSVYNQFRFDGKQNDNVSIYLNYSVHNFTFFSEVAQSLHAGHAQLAGLLGSLSSQLDVSLLYRNYAPDFYSFNSNAFAESSTPQNETGLYGGWKYHINRNYMICGYVDLFRFPWLRFRSYAPSDGHEWLLRVQGRLSRQVSAYIQIKEEIKARNSSDDEASLYSVHPGKKQSYLANISVRPTQKLHLKTRVHYSTYTFEKSKSSGLSLVQDIQYHIGAFTFSARHALFDTDNYDNRHYVFEDDAWLSFSFPAYYGTGVRNYIMVEYNLNKNITLWARYARTRYTDRTTIGSGLDAIDGNTKNDLKFQVKFRI